MPFLPRNTTYPIKFFRILDDDYAMCPVSIQVNVKALFSESLNEFILLCHQHGICEHLKSKSFIRRPEDPPDDEPQVLTMEKLSAGFYVWLGSVILSVLVFVCEHIFFNVTLRSRES